MSRALWGSTEDEVVRSTVLDGEGHWNERELSERETICFPALRYWWMEFEKETEVVVVMTTTMDPDSYSLTYESPFLAGSQSLALVVRVCIYVAVVRREPSTHLVDSCSPLLITCTMHIYSNYDRIHSLKCCLRSPLLDFISWLLFAVSSTDY